MFANRAEQVATARHYRQGDTFDHLSLGRRPAQEQQADGRAAASKSARVRASFADS
jgi:hypothetical protein